MTEQEAIKILSKDTSMEAVNELSYYGGFSKDYVVERIQEAMDMGAKALEKQVSKKPIQDDGYYCPFCNNRVAYAVRGYKQPYCMECGQKIDWDGVR